MVSTAKKYKLTFIYLCYHINYMLYDNMTVWLYTFILIYKYIPIEYTLYTIHIYVVYVYVYSQCKIRKRLVILKWHFKWYNHDGVEKYKLNLVILTSDSVTFDAPHKQILFVNSILIFNKLSVFVEFHFVPIFLLLMT